VQCNFRVQGEQIKKSFDEKKKKKMRKRKKEKKEKNV
jgi:hypothetical protein